MLRFRITKPQVKSLLLMIRIQNAQTCERTIIIHIIVVRNVSTPIFVLNQQHYQLVHSYTYTYSKYCNYYVYPLQKLCYTKRISVFTNATFNYNAIMFSGISMGIGDLVHSCRGILRYSFKFSVFLHQ